MTLAELKEYVHSIRCACQIAHILIAWEREDLLPTILEYAAMDMQAIMLDYCAHAIDCEHTASNFPQEEVDEAADLEGILQ